MLEPHLFRGHHLLRQDYLSNFAQFLLLQMIRVFRFHHLLKIH
jgi:hypothetical protein